MSLIPSNNLIPSNKNNPCPVCEDSNGKCRQGKNDPDYWQCMTYSDSRKGEVYNGFKCIGHTRDQLWGQFKLEDRGEHYEQRILQKDSRTQTQGRTSSIPVSPVQRQARNESGRMAANGEDVPSCTAKSGRETNHLCNGGRDRAIRNLHKHFGLSERHREDLRKRGLIDSQIEHQLYFSITPNQQVPIGIPANLPGVKDGKIKAAGTGYACITFDPQGKATGWQIRLDDATDNKYRWAKGQVSSHLPNGELPITSVYPNEIKHPAIWMAEGINKPAIASHRLGIVTIGAASANFAASPEQTEEHLRVASERLETKEIIFPPDAGAVKNSHVLKAYRRSWELFAQLGYQVNVAWWNQIDKTDLDIDELQPGHPIELLSVEDFQAICREQGGLAQTEKADYFTTLLNPPLIASSPIQSFKDGIFKVLPIPESVKSCLTTEEKAPRKKRRWFESILKRLKKVFSKIKSKVPRLGFKCFREENLDFEERIRQVQCKLRSLSYEADIELNQRYLPDELVNQLPKSGLIGIKAPKGCGKSVLLKKIIALAKKQGIPVLSITPRIALGREQAIKWEVTWIDDYGVMQTRAEDTTKQIAELAEKRNQAKAKLSELEKPQQFNLLDELALEKVEQQKEDLRAEIDQYEQQIENVSLASVNTLGLCWDSIWRTKDRDMKNSLVIIDEAELGFNHFIAGSTCRRNRPYLLKVFTDKIRECLMSGGRVILSDADLTDLPINYVRELLPIPINPFIVRNEYIGDETKWLVDFRSGSRGDTLDEILGNIKLGFYLVITTDSQAEAEALERKILNDCPDFCTFLDSEGEVTAEAKKGEKAIVVRLDRNTAESEAGRKFIQKPNESILRWKPRVLIYTPTLGVGVSIDESTQRIDQEWGDSTPYFDFVYGLFFGVIEPSQCRQQLARIRANISRIIWCKEFNRGLEGCTSFFPDEVKRQMLKYSQSALSIIDLAKAIAGYQADDEQIREAMLTLLHEAWDSESRCWKDPSLDLYAAFKARENYSLWNLANVLREELEDEGHTVLCLEGFKSELLEEIAAIKDHLKMEEAVLIAQAPLMPLEQAQKLLSKIGITKEERRSATKTLLQDELPGVELTAEFIYKAVVSDRRRWLNRHKLFWYCLNLDATKTTDTDHWLSRMRKFVEGKPFIPDTRSFSPKVQAIRESGVFEIFVELDKLEKIYEGDSEEATRFHNRCLMVKDSLQTSLAISVTKKSEPIALANRILSKVGLGLQKLTRSKKDKRYRLAAELVTDPDRLAVLDALDLKWQIACNPVRVGAEVGGELPHYIDTKPSSPPIVEEISQGIIDSFPVSTTAIPAVLDEKWQIACNPVTASAEVGGELPHYIDTKPSSPPSVEEISQGSESTVEDLAVALEFCESPADFALVAGGVEPEIVQTAIALQDSQPKRFQLSQWLAVVGENQAIASTEATTELNPVEGCRVRIKQKLLDNRPSLMLGLEGVVKAISVLGRVTVEAFGRIEYFNRCEVEFILPG